MFIKLIFASACVSTLLVAAVPYATQKSLLSIAKTADLEFLIDRNTLLIDVEDSTFQFDLHTVFTAKTLHEGKEVSRVIERGLILCTEKAFITTNQSIFDKDGEIIEARNSARVYSYTKNGFNRQLVDFFCPQPSAPRNPKKSKDLIV